MGIAGLGSFRCECGRLLTVRTDSRLAFCPCGARNEVTEIEPYRSEPTKIKPVCVHRGPHVANASCRCGPIYQCNLGGLCGNGKPVDQYVTITFLDGSPRREFKPGEYQKCGKGECPKFSLSTAATT